MIPNFERKLRWMQELSLSLRAVLLRTMCPTNSINFLGPDTHNRIRCQPSIVILQHYNDSRHTVDLKQRVETIEEYARLDEELAYRAN